MSDLNRPITFGQLLTRCPRIEVPLIQRDFAQGRETEKEVRDDFLKALHDALTLPVEKYSSPLNLDFVYGSMEQGESGNFLPLDGQQRLTTLFLVHWYLAWRDGTHAEFERMLWDGKHSRFAYAVRPSSTEFFDQLARYVPDVPPEYVPSVKKVLEDQPWFFLHWRLDPTVQSVLVVLDAIHGLFSSEAGLYARLVDEQKPAITFQLLPLKHFGLTDDLYIKMNARGKPLTQFETFKARFEALLSELFPTERRMLGGTQVTVAEFFERRIDTEWTDLFWKHRDPVTHTFDDRLMNLLVAIARATMDPNTPSFQQDTSLLRGGRPASFSLFHEHGWLTRDFTRHLISLLEAWSGGTEGQRQILPNDRYFDEAAFFEQAIGRPAALGYVQLVQFAAFVFYLTHHEGSIDPIRFNEWMRVVRNLAANSLIERPEEYGRALAGLRKLLPNSAAILERLCDTDIGQIGFSPQQVDEEVFKARLILADDGWKERIETAEDHGYFSGQIDFLLDFCGASAEAKRLPSNWGKDDHQQLQADFDLYSEKAQITFNSAGLTPIRWDDAEGLAWKRALLCVGDYLPRNGSNYSFLTNPPANWDSWKRFLRDGADVKRQFLKVLWDRIDANADIAPQLERIIANAENLEPWRAAIIRHPNVISYCGEQEIRRGSGEEVYLLKKKQMSGYHAELFSYVLYLELDGAFASSLAPLVLRNYVPVYLTECEPHILLEFNRSGNRVDVVVESANGQFRIHVSSLELQNLPEVESALCEGAAFTKVDGSLNRLVPRDEIRTVLQEMARSLKKLSD